MDRKRELSLIVILTLLLSVPLVLYNANLGKADYVPPVWHNSGIYILSNGTITPSSAPISRQGDTYKLTADAFAGIAIQKDGIVLDGNGFGMFGPNYGTGVLLQNVNNVTVQNFNMHYFEQGIYLDDSNASIIERNTLTDCSIDITQNSTSNQVTGNTVNAAEILVEFSENNIVTQNMASNIAITWSSNNTISENKVSDAKLINTSLNFANFTEGICIDNSNNCTISGNIVENKNVGIDIWQSFGLTFKKNTLQNNQVGFKLWGSDLKHNIQSIDTSNTVNGKPIYFLVNKTDYQVPTNAGWIAAVNSKNITVQNWVSTPNWDGVLFVDTYDSKITNSNLTSNFNAIRLQNVSNCLITQNELDNSQYAALYFEETSNSTITGNEVINNYCFFDIWHNSTGNTFYHNDFVGNWTGTISEESQNQWDNGSEGNYWSTFTGVDLNHNGVSDYAYIIDTNSSQTDKYPLMAPQNSQAIGAAQQQIQNSGLLLAMPEEYINYTITENNGTMWAKIDGLFPIHVTSKATEPLSMIYSIPPGATNIHIKLDGTEQTWNNYSAINSSAIKSTEFSNWQMINCTIKPASTDFLLEINYEHPIEVINGSYTFLYDLDVTPYLSVSSVISIAHFNVQLPQNESNLNLFTIGSNGTWNAMNYNSTENASGKTVTFNIVSEYNRPLLSYVAFVLGSPQIPEFQLWATFLLFAIITVGVAMFQVRRRRPKSPNSNIYHGEN